jgi:ElaB/YqjD/DUF883 family membrane-anchored ribosome-binding protein
MRNRLMKGLQRPMRPVTEHAADRAHEAIDRAAAQVGGAEARLRQAADASAETLAATGREAKAALAKTGGVLRRHPFATAAAGCALLAAGATLAARRRNHRSD